MSATHHAFLDVMEDLGFLDHIYEELPRDFTAVFEIARILEDPDNPLTAQLRPLLHLAPAALPPEQPRPAHDRQVVFTDAEEHEADMLRSYAHLPRIYSRQWLLPDELFDRRLARRELWAPYPRAPRLFSVEPDEDEYRPDSRKQKLYILLDTSSSMAVHNRVNLAKAVVYHILRRNLKELGDIQFRSFDTAVGPLHEARDAASFHALLRHVMRVRALGNGTAMARAIETAVRDVTALPRLAGTEILIITDGACALDEARIRDLLGDRIVIHTLKIGRARVIASRGYINDKLFHEDTEQHRVLARLQAQAADVRRRRDAAQAPHTRRRYEESLRAVEQEIERQVNAMTEEIIVGYGSELERLSQRFITIDDQDLPGLFGFREEHLDAMRALYGELAARLDLAASVEQLRRLALLLDHLVFMSANTADGGLRERFEALQHDLAGRLSAGVEARMRGAGGGLRPGSDDAHDLQFLLAASATLHPGVWRALLWRMLRRIRGAFGRAPLQG